MRDAIGNVYSNSTYDDYLLIYLIIFSFNNKFRFLLLLRILIMSTFFAKYKKMRRDQKIDLADIENRTKINVKYLEAIENGNFEIIHKPYLRLFLKAYINEIGADPQVAIDELTEYLLKSDGNIEDKKDKPEEPKKVEKPSELKSDKSKPDKEIPLAIIPEKKKKQFNIPPNIIKGILFIIVWIIIIIVIRNITIESNTSDQSIIPNQQTELISNFVDFEQLQSDYTETSSMQNALEISAPFIVKVISKNTLGIVSHRDTFNIESIPMARGSQYTFKYDTELDMVLKHSNGVSIFVNGNALEDMKSQTNPVQLTFSTNPNSITIKHYLPVE